MKNFLWNKFQDEIGEPPWDYYFLQNLPESEYPRYLAKLFYLNTGEKLPLKHGVIDKKKLKTFNQKIQWIKLYGVTDLMRDCTDKVKVRDYVKGKIGEEYLKPVLQIIPNNTSVIATNQPLVSLPNFTDEGTDSFGRNDSILGDEAIQRNLRKGETRVNEGIAYDSDSEVCDLPERQQIQRQEEVKQVIRNENSGIKPEFQNVDCRGTEKAVVPRNDGEPNAVSAYFDKIDFNKLPNSFVIKTNHGCKWHCIIKNKNEFLKNKQLYETVKKDITGWLEQEYWIWGGFELQYKGIIPKILIEPLMRDEINTAAREIEVYCFNGKPKIFVNARYGEKREISYYDENFNIIDLVFHNDEKNVIKQEKADCLIKQTFDLSAKLCTSTTRLAKDQMTTGVSRRNDSRTRKQFQENQLSKGFSFVRCDWLVFNNKLYFNELTFTPYSGLMRFNKKWNLKLGKLILLNKEF